MTGLALTLDYVPDRSDWKLIETRQRFTVTRWRFYPWGTPTGAVQRLSITALLWRHESGVHDNVNYDGNKFHNFWWYTDTIEFKTASQPATFALGSKRYVAYMNCSRCACDNAVNIAVVFHWCRLSTACIAVLPNAGTRLYCVTVPGVRPLFRSFLLLVASVDVFVVVGGNHSEIIPQWRAEQHKSLSTLASILRCSVA